MLKPIVITGFMGSGKSRVARELAERLAVTVIDLDDSIAEREGKSPAQLIVEHGEPYFRTIESRVLRDLLQTREAGIIALGGGAWIMEMNRKLIDEYGCVSVWLDTPFEVCWTRIETSEEDRPLGRTREQALALYERRRPLYQLASIHVQTTGDDLEDLISRLERKLILATNFTNKH
jgi:shikimate kinase